MHRSINLPPEWQPVAITCPDCRATLQAKYNPNTGALEALRCPDCPWAQDYVAIARKRALRLAAARRQLPSSERRQSRLN